MRGDIEGGATHGQALVIPSAPRKPHGKQSQRSAERQKPACTGVCDSPLHWTLSSWCKRCTWGLSKNLRPLFQQKTRKWWQEEAKRLSKPVRGNWISGDTPFVA